MEAVGSSIKGPRKENQDSYLIDAKRRLFIVADGMGGHNAGQLASTTAVQGICRFFEQKELLSTDDPVHYLQMAFEYSNEEIRTITNEDQNMQGMGTTLTLALIEENMLYIGHIGDSRAYLIHEGKIQQLTEDHSYVAELLRNGGISEQDAINHPQKNLLTRALTGSDTVEVDIQVKEMPWLSTLLLCTDGLSNAVDENRILDILTGTTTQRAVDALLEEALANGATDNITVVLVNNYGLK